MADKKSAKFDFPFKGLNENFAYRQPPEGTSSDALNVRAYDSIGQRQRGGQRNGLTKYAANAVNGSNPIQAISQLTTAFDPTNVVPGNQILNEQFLYTPGWMGAVGGGAANWAIYESGPNGNVINVPDNAGVSPSHAITAVAAHTITFAIATGTQVNYGFAIGTSITITGSTNNNGTYTVSGVGGAGTNCVVTITATLNTSIADGLAVIDRAPLISVVGSNSVVGPKLAAQFQSGLCLSQPGGVPQNLGTTFVLTAAIRFVASSSVNSSHPSVCFIFRALTSPAEPLDVTKYGNASVFYDGASATVQAQIRVGNTFSTAVKVAGPATSQTVAAWNAAEHTMQLTGSGNIFRLYIDGVQTAILSSASLSAQTRWGFSVSADPSSTNTYLRNLQAFVGVVPASLRTTRLITVSGGTVYAGTATNLPAIPGNTMNGSGIVRVQQAFGKAYFADGDPTHYNVYDPNLGSVASWIPTTGSLPAGSVNPVTTAISAASIGSSNFTVGSAAGITTGSIVVVSGGTETPSNNGTYRVTNVVGTTISVSPAPLNGTPTGSPVMSLPLQGATMITLYRGRIVLAGLASDPQNWFMSAAGNPLDWNYTPTVLTQTMAVAGNNSQAGLMGDVVTCLMPYNDDLMFMGGDHTLWVMRGDPAAGGLIDNVSFQTGVVGPDAWTRDPAGNLYFFGEGSFWRIASGSTIPEPLSRGVLDHTFGSIDYTLFRVRLFWDDIEKGVHMYFTPDTLPGTAPIHYFWDKRAGGFWRDQYQPTQGPTAVWNYDADLPTDRAFILGGFDSFLRQLPATNAKSDDGTPISSHVRYTTQIYGGDLANTRMSSLVPILSATSDPVSVRVFTDETAELVATSGVPQVSSVLSPGRNATLRQRMSGNAFSVELDNTPGTWTTATYYAPGVQMIHGTDLHTCLAAHTSGVFATDLAAADWTAVGVATARSWAVEGIEGVVETTGRTRNRRI